MNGALLPDSAASENNWYFVQLPLSHLAFQSMLELKQFNDTNPPGFVLPRGSQACNVFSKMSDSGSVSIFVLPSGWTVTVTVTSGYSCLAT